MLSPTVDQMYDVMLLCCSLNFFFREELKKEIATNDIFIFLDCCCLLLDCCCLLLD